MIKELIKKNRSYRRFHQNEAISRDTLVELIELARFSPSGGNVQPLKFFLANDPKINEVIFPNLAWAGYLQGWDGPAEGERPSAYIIVLGDKEVASSFGCDHGIASQSILLGAAEKGIGGCMIGSIQRDSLRKAIGLEDRYKILLVLALGKPSETVVLEDLNESGSIEYYRADDDVHHVPKRPLSELVIN